MPCRIVIAGAGPVGLAVAVALARSPHAGRLRITVVDSRPPPRWDAATVDLRVYALSRASQQLLASLGAWDAIAAARVSPYRTMQVWEGEHSDATGTLGFDSADIGEPDLGHIVEDTLIRVQLHERLRELGCSGVRFGCSVSGFSRTSGQVLLTLADGERLEADLVVAADGSDSPLRRLAQLPVCMREYGQHALVTHVATEFPHRLCARQRFMPGGPLALLPLADGRVSIVWSLPSERAMVLRDAAEPDFLHALTDASGRVLGSLYDCAERVVLPLRALHARRYSAPGVVLAGDSAHTVHPLAGQGMNLGLLDAACLSRTLCEAITEGQHPGDHRVLRRYERRSQREDLAMLIALDAMEQGFSRMRWLAPARRVGLSLVNACRPARQMLMRRALGISSVRV